MSVGASLLVIRMGWVILVAQGWSLLSFGGADENVSESLLSIWAMVLSIDSINRDRLP